jgi:hypothetical protein
MSSLTLPESSLGWDGMNGGKMIGGRGRSALRPGAAWVALLAALCLSACGRPASDPELRIREVLAAAELAAETGGYETLAGMVARDYADSEGRDRRALRLLLRGMMIRYPRAELIVTVREIEILSPRLARVRLDILAAGAGGGGLSADAFPMELSLRDDGDGWQVTRAEWGRRSGGGI